VYHTTPGYDVHDNELFLEKLQCYIASSLQDSEKGRHSCSSAISLLLCTKFCYTVL